MTEPGWYNDDHDPTLARWYDGTRWTEHTLVKADWQDRGTPPPPDPARTPAFRAAPAAAPAPAAPRPTQKPKRGCLWWIGAAVVAAVVLGIIAAIAGGDDAAKKAEERQQERQASIEDDVTNIECVRAGGAFSTMLARVTVTNNSSDRSNYVIEVSFESADGSQQYATGTAVLNGLNPGQTTTAEADSYTDATTPELTCVVQDVSRFSDEP